MNKYGKYEPYYATRDVKTDNYGLGKSSTSIADSVKEFVATKYVGQPNTAETMAKMEEEMKRRLSVALQPPPVSILGHTHNVGYYDAGTSSSANAPNVASDKMYLTEVDYIKALESNSLVKRAQILFDDREDTGEISIQLELRHDYRYAADFDATMSRNSLNDILQNTRIKGAKKMVVSYLHKEVFT